jgi:hypothetical protein
MEPVRDPRIEGGERGAPGDLPGDDEEQDTRDAERGPAGDGERARREAPRMRLR